MPSELIYLIVVFNLFFFHVKLHNFCVSGSKLQICKCVHTLHYRYINVLYAILLELIIGNLDVNIGFDPWF